MTAQLSPDLLMIASALDTLAVSAHATNAARERMTIALATSRLALASEQSVLCLDRDVAPECYSFEEAQEAASRRPQSDLLAAGLETPAPHNVPHTAPKKKK